MTHSVTASTNTSGADQVLSLWRSYVDGKHPENHALYCSIVAERRLRLMQWADYQENNTELKKLFAKIEDSQIVPLQRIERAIQMLKVAKPMIAGCAVATVSTVRELLLEQSQDDLLIASDQLYGFKTAEDRTMLLQTPFVRLVEGYKELCLQNPVQHLSSGKYSILATVVQRQQCQSLARMADSLRLLNESAELKLKFITILREYNQTDDLAQAREQLLALRLKYDTLLAESLLSLLDRSAITDMKTKLQEVTLLFVFAEQSPVAKEQLKILIAKILPQAPIPPKASAELSLFSVFASAMNSLCDCFGYLKL